MTTDTYQKLPPRYEGHTRIHRRRWMQSGEIKGVLSDAVYYCAIQERKAGEWRTIKNWRPSRGWQDREKV